jgi:hypothetical protein
VFRLPIIIFSVEAVIMFSLVTLFPQEHSVPISIADAAMLVILSGPFLWYFIVHPLRHTAIAEHLQPVRSPLTNVIGVAEMMREGPFGSVNEDQKNGWGKLALPLNPSYA